MGERLQIAEHANLVDEAFLLLYQWINNVNLEQIQEEYRDYYLEKPESYQRKWNIVREMFHAVIEQLSPKKERVEYYFKAQEGSFAFNAAFAYLYDFSNTDSRVLTYEERFRNITESDRIIAYSVIINFDAKDNTVLDQTASYADLVEYIDHSSCEKEKKWEILQIYHHQEECYQEVADIIQEVAELLRSKFGDQIAEFEKEFYDYWNDIETKKGIIKLIQETLQLTWNENEDGTRLLPMLLQPISVTLASDLERDKQDIIRIGVLMDDRLILSGSKLKEEDVVNFGKLLSDKSKVDILTLTATKPCYGKEIARELNLSTATISYHVNALIKLGFLKTELNANRVYYSINRERISEYLEGIKNFFNGK